MDQHPRLIDWDVATATGARLVRPGPAVLPAEARQAVADLHRFAEVAREEVSRYVGMSAGGDGALVAVLDRPGWVRANAATFAVLMDPLVAKLAARRDHHPAGRLREDLAARITGVEAGALLAFLAGKVLGQYELFRAGPSGAPEPGPGRLLLVAPNIVAAERQMNVDARDFRLWVCLHEETHRVQFGAVPWLRDHLLDLMRQYLDETELEPAELLRRTGAAAGVVGRAVLRQGEASLADAFQTPRQRELVGQVTAVMSLLEGHADFVMDGVGAAVVPTVEHLRRQFAARRANAGWLDGLLRRLLGVEAKLRQYRDGERFVRGVVEQVGMAGFNRVWDSAASLPTQAELAAPEQWVARVHAPAVPA